MSYRDPYTDQQDDSTATSSLGHLYNPHDQDDSPVDESPYMSRQPYVASSAAPSTQAYYGQSQASSRSRSYRDNNHRQNTYESGYTSPTGYNRPGYNEDSYEQPAYNYPPVQPQGTMNRSQTTKSRLSKKLPEIVEVMNVPGPTGGKSGSGFEKGEFTQMGGSKRRTPSAYRQYRYNNQGNLWTKGSRGRVAVRFCFCTILTAIFLIVSIVLALILWVRPPNVVIGNAKPVTSGSTFQTTSNGGFMINLGIDISVTNFNYFDVDFKKIDAEIFYPIDNTPIGGGVANNINFKSGLQTNFTFPFGLKYSPSQDTSGRILADIATKCGLGGQKSDINITYKITLAIRLLFITISPTISNPISFACPISASDIGKLVSGKS